MLEQWVAAGQDPAALWDNTPREIDHIIRAASYRDQAQAWLVGRYVAKGYHSPADYPAAPKLIDHGASNAGADAEIAAIRRRVRVALDTRKSGGRNGN